VFSLAWPSQGEPHLSYQLICSAALEWDSLRTRSAYRRKLAVGDRGRLERPVIISCLLIAERINPRH